MILSTNKYPARCSQCRRWVEPQAGFIEPPAPDGWSGSKFTIYCHECGTKVMDDARRDGPDSPSDYAYAGPGVDWALPGDDPGSSPTPDPGPMASPGATIPPEIAAFIDAEMGKFRDQLTESVRENERLKDALRRFTEDYGRAVRERSQAINERDELARQADFNRIDFDGRLRKARQQTKEAQEECDRLRAKMRRKGVNPEPERGDDPQRDADDDVRKAREDRDRRMADDARAARDHRERQERARRACEEPSSGSAGSQGRGRFHWTSSDFDFSSIFDNWGSAYGRSPFTSTEDPRGSRPNAGGPTIFPPSPAMAALGLPDDAAPDRVKAAYRERSKSAHPDGGGSVADFVKLKNTYDAALQYAERRARAGR